MRDQIGKMNQGSIELRKPKKQFNLIKATKRIPQAMRQNTMRDLRTAMLLEGMKPRIPRDFASTPSIESELPTLQKAKQLSFRLSEAEKAAMAKESER